MPSRLRGDLLSEDGFYARVHSVFRSVVNLEPEIDFTYPLVALASERVGNMPGVVLIVDDGHLDWTEWRIAPGDRVIVRGSFVHVGDAVTVDLSDATEWQPWRRVAGPLAPPDEIYDRIDRFGEYCTALSAPGFGILHAMRPKLLAGVPSSWSELPPLAAAGSKRIASLVRALRAGSVDEALSAARGLMGLGIGGTPSGDDVLVGMFGTFALMSEAVKPLPGIEEITRGLRPQVLGNTSKLSELFLLAVLDGEVSESLEQVVRSLVAQEPPYSSYSARILLHGGSSGVEIALGSLVALELLLDR